MDLGLLLQGLSGLGGQQQLPPMQQLPPGSSPWASLQGLPPAYEMQQYLSQPGQQGAVAGAAGGGGIGGMLGGGLMGLLSSVFAGIGARAGERRKEKKWEKQLAMLKPDQPYHGVERGLPQIDPVVQKVIMGMLGERGIPMGSFGIDPTQLLASLGQQGSQTPARRGGGSTRPTHRQGRI